MEITWKKHARASKQNLKTDFDGRAKRDGLGIGFRGGCGGRGAEI